MTLEIIDSAADVDGAVLVLCKIDDIWEVRVDHHLLMAEDDHVSEDALATIGLRDLPKGGRVLIGGLGLGFTLRRALDVADAAASVVVCERCGPLVGWNREHVGALAGHPLNDARVTVVVDDVRAVVAAEQDAWDAIVLDVDNGPEAIVHDDNAGLYGAAGLSAAFAALKKGGVYVVWSAGADDGFRDRVEAAGFIASAVPIEDDVDGELHVVFVGKKP